MATLYGRLGEPDGRTPSVAKLWWVMALRGLGAFVLGTPPVMRGRLKRS